MHNSICRQEISISSLGSVYFFVVCTFDFTRNCHGSEIAFCLVYGNIFTMYVAVWDQLASSWPGCRHHRTHTPCYSSPAMPLEMVTDWATSAELLTRAFFIGKYNSIVVKHDME